MERPLANAATGHLWNVVCSGSGAGLRSDLVTDVHEQGEESEKENDSILEFASESDAPLANSNKDCSVECGNR